MLDPVNSAAIIARVGFFLSRYNSYKFDKRKEDDASIRKWIATNLESTKTLSIMSLIHNSEPTRRRGIS